MTFKQSLSNSRSEVIPPYGGKLENLMVPYHSREKILSTATKTIECSDRNACDIELLVIGGFSPLRGFMNKENYESVVKRNRTSDGRLFGLPIVMDTNREDLEIGEKVLLRYKEQDLAVLTINDKWEPDKVLEAKGCYGTTSLEHPAVRMISMERKQFYLGGELEGIELPKRIFPCKTPSEVRESLPKDQDVVAFQCRNPIHRAH